ncbi:septal ring lytic transglycosylase RlpA family protein [Massilia sp. PAMC28688]|nr:septal ring lytic transglycosylase RlpA family protein [Massilia sp. PAMC28688]
MPAPKTRAATHPALDPDMPALPPANSGRGGYYKDDGPGDNPPSGLRDIPDAVVRAEPYSRYANRPYVVFGKSYTPMLGDQPFVQRGVSSWYGKKFHGQRTSSGEIYDMYKMTAAHPTLPIPSYARITNIATGNQVVVRINDRGPFHASRIVDVSFTAAVKLGLLQKGSHEVLLERLLPGQDTRLAAAPRSDPEPQQPRQGVLQAAEEVGSLIVSNRAEVKAIKLHPEARVAPTVDGAPAPAGESFYVQMGAFSRADKAAEVRTRVLSRGWVSAALDVIKAGSLHRLVSGPFATRDAALEAARSLPATLGIKPMVIKR